MDRRKIIIYIIVGILLTTCGLIFVMRGITEISSHNEKNSEESYDKNDSNSNIGGGEETQYICDVSAIKEARIDYTPCVDLQEQLKEDAFLKEWGETLAEVLGENKSSLLYGKEGCYLSTKGVCLFDIAEYELANIVRCFIFSEDGEYAGEIYFFEENGQLDFNVVMKNVEYDIQSDVLSALEAVPQEKLIFVTNGYRYTTLNENNELGKLSGDVSFEVSGDCYNELNDESLAVSYEDIMDRDNWVWVEFERVTDN